jgi:hypothetical protein
MSKTTSTTDEARELASFGIRKFNTEKFENSDKHSTDVRSPIDSAGVDRAFAAFCAVIPAEDALPPRWS